MVRMIKSTGPTPCRLLLVGERPGVIEAGMGRVLVGPSGQEVDRFLLTETGVDRENVHCCNLVRDYRDGANPDDYEIVRDWPLLVEEILHVRPQYVLAMGLYSARAFLGRDLDLEWAHGLHFPLKWASGAFTVMPAIHTAATLHQPKYAAQCAYDFRQFGRLIHGEPLPTGHLQPQLHCSYSDTVLPLDSTIVGMDTEGTVERPWGLSYSTRAGVAAVQHHYRHRQWRCKRMEEITVVLHSAMHDLPILKRMGVRPRQWQDTMLKAALLGTEPLGLKALCRRHCGMLMRDYDSVMAGARQDLAMDYLGKAVDWAVEQEAVHEQR